MFFTVTRAPRWQFVAILAAVVSMGLLFGQDTVFDGTVTVLDNEGLKLGTSGDGTWKYSTANTRVEFGTLSGDVAFVDDGGVVLTFLAAPVFPSYVRHQDIEINAAIIGGGSPVIATVGTFAGLLFDSNGEIFDFSFDVPAAWDGASDISLMLDWTNQAGTAIGAGETVIWDCDLSTRAVGEDLDAVAATNTTVTYTQSGAGTDGEFFQATLVVDFDDATNPVAVGDKIGFKCFRDFSADTYAADALLFLLELEYNSTTIGAN